MKKLTAIVLALAITVSGTAVFASGDSSGKNAVFGGTAHIPASGGGSGKTLAFPTAEGGGMYTKGARAVLDYGERIEVYHVTNLNDSGAGSFRDAVSKGNRIVVFDVSGMIDLKSNVSISKPNMTILGQTAPGDGICFRGDNIKVSADNIILRYLRFRVGAEHEDGTVTPARDGLEITDNVSNAIIDHCSVSWGTDENLSAYAVKDVTIQWSIIAEALNQSVHDKGEHSYGAIWGGVNLTVHHNLIATHKSRNPKIGTSETVAMTKGYTDKETVVDLRNNVIYNWGDKAGYGAENGANVNIVNNYYKPGPSTPDNKKARIFELSPGNKYKANWSGAVWADGNYVDCDNADAAAVNADNWQIECKTGVYLDSRSPLYEKLGAPNETYLGDYPITTTDAQTAYEEVLENAGARMPKLDLVDQRIIDNVKNGTAPDGSKGSIGLVDDPRDGVPKGQESLYDDRGYPIWQSVSRTADYDTDGDGLPDAWEDRMGLNKNNPTDSTFIGPEGYTYLEIFAEEGITHEAGDVSLAVGGARATLFSATGGEYDVYVDDKYFDTVKIQGGIPEGNALITAAYEGNKLLEVKTAKYTGGGIEYPAVTASGTVKHFIWNGLDGMKPVAEAGGSAAIDLSGETGMHTVTAVAPDGSVYSNVAYLCCEGTDTEPRRIQGDFTVVMNLSQIPTVIEDSYGVLAITNGGASIALGAGCNDKYEKTIVHQLNNDDGFIYNSLGNTSMLKAERKGNTISLYKGTSLLDWTLLGSAAVSGAETVMRLSDVAMKHNPQKSAANISYRLVTEQTAPRIEIVNVAENQRLGFNENIEVNVTPDTAAVQEINVLFKGNMIASKSVNVTSGQTVTIPVAFSGIDSGLLTVSCVDSNLCTATDSVNITVSADLTPWQIADIGAADGDVKTYVSVTDDYTYKINSPSGNIGAASDKCGYVYQKFTGSNRIYYRSRMQGAEQFGIMLRKSLDADSEMYWFGGEKAGGNLAYHLKHRTDGGDTVTDYTFDNQQANLYFIAEKDGGTLNIYQTENGATIYTTKTKIASIDVSGLGDEYYMGFAASGGGSNPPDAGWVATEGFDALGASRIWSFDYGLDWLWQMQEANALRPSWENGKMIISPGDDYTSERYIFHEYTMDDSLLPSMNAVVMLTGESPAMNIYFQTGDANTAYKITFDSDGKVRDCAGNELCAYETNEYYNIAMRADIDAESGAAVCSLDIAKAVENGEALVTGAAVLADKYFRTQNNVEKKTPVKKAVYFEPDAGAEGRYYADDVRVWGEEPSVTVEKTESWYNFSALSGDDNSTLSAFTVDAATSQNGSELSGETLSVASGATFKTGNKSADGYSFTNRIRIKNNNGKITLPVKKGSVVTVYGASANSSSTRSLYIDGTEYGLLNACASAYEYTGEDGNITIYGGDNIEIYGISVITTRIVKQ